MCIRDRVAHSWYGIGITCWHLKMYEESLRALERGVTIRKELYGRVNQTAAVAFVWMMKSLAASEKDEEMKATQGMAVQVFSEAFGITHPNTIHTIMWEAADE
eukprot:TRINITY_DN22650_c0_g1_i1.p2 TRINITY_DN22650_c0_g1~~TRINITY_DN22650_c0_g1_i1.p2  ORF type:complete len:103 (+),score=13.89 TRINITY_DN22650_c0_g1_i1:64-372(+)